MALGYDVSVWERYAIEFALSFGETTARIRAVSRAYHALGFDVDLICELSGFPVWRVRQALSDTGDPEPG